MTMDAAVIVCTQQLQKESVSHQSAFPEATYKLQNGPHPFLGKEGSH